MLGFRGGKKFEGRGRERGGEAGSEGARRMLY